MPRAKKFVLPYDGDPYGKKKKPRKHKGRQSEEAIERKKKNWIAGKEARRAGQQQREDGELLDPKDVVDVPPNVGEPRAQVIVAEDALLESAPDTCASPQPTL